MHPPYPPIPIFYEIEGKLHRAWRDESGDFTLEQDNFDAARKAGHLKEVSFTDIEALTDRCQNCFLR